MAKGESFKKFELLPLGFQKLSESRGHGLVVVAIVVNRMGQDEADVDLIFRAGSTLGAKRSLEKYCGYEEMTEICIKDC